MTNILPEVNFSPIKKTDPNTALRFRKFPFKITDEILRSQGLKIFTNAYCTTSILYVTITVYTALKFEHSNKLRTSCDSELERQF
jgi:uncharacterized membrane protein